MHTQQVIGHITNWLKEYLTNAGLHGYVIGVSGGIDSAVTSTLCAQTGHPLRVIEMPIHQARDQVTRAQDHMQWLVDKFPNVKQSRVDLTPSYDAFAAAVNSNSDLENTGLALANARARLRMTTLYYYAGLENRLVAGTGNKVEDFGVGFFTKYGDGGVDVSPIADLMKSEVFELARELDIIQSIQSAQPTDGLWSDNRTDEDQMGATYPELEWAMLFQGNESDLNERQKEVLAIYHKLNCAMQHKINPIPVCKIPAELK